MASHGKFSKQYFQCDHCGNEGSFDLQEGRCAHPGCEKDLCGGCLHSCLICDEEFCPEHTFQAFAPGLLYMAQHMAGYVCATCTETRKVAQEAA